MLGMGLGIMHISSMSAFIAPLEQEFHWSRAQISSALSIVTVFSVVAAYFVGLLIDRIGPRRIALPGAITYCLAFASLAAMTNSTLHWVLCWVAIGVSVQFVKPTVWAAAVASRFSRSRGLAIAVTMAGAGIATAVNPVLATMLLQGFSWRVAYLGLAASWGLIAIPICWLAFYGANDNRIGSTRSHGPRDRGMIAGVDLKDAFLGHRFWLIAFGIVMTTAVTMGLIVHFIPVAMDNGLSGAQAAAAAGSIGLSSIAGRLLTGYLIDRLSGRLVGSAAFVMPAIACWLLLYEDSLFSYVIAASVLGFSLGADADVGAYLMSRYFGLRNFGALYGALIGLIGLATGGGPLIAGLVYDNLGNYQTFLHAGIPVSIVAASLLLFIGKYPDLPERSQENGGGR